MAEFLTTHGTIARIEQIISKARERIVLLSPYLRWSDILYQRLREADQLGIPIVFVYGKAELRPDQRKLLDKLEHLSLYFCASLHAKCYFNEQQMVISSFNLYEASEKNREMGIALERNESIYREAQLEAQSILAASQLKAGKPATLVEPPKPKCESVSPPARQRSPGKSGFCLRCAIAIPLNRNKPLCPDCYATWALFENPDFEEKFCHECGEPTRSSMRRPLCDRCFGSGF